MLVTLSDIQKAQVNLSRWLQPTPLLYNGWLSEFFKADIYLKLENMQPIGSFKIRGATNKILNLTPAERKRGVIAASAGNHAQGVAWGSRKLGVSSLIVMPTSAPLMKIQNTQLLGGEVRLEGESYDDAYKAALKIAKKTGRNFVHAFEDRHVIAGQGTIGLEILTQLPEVDLVLGSMGGGGMMSGISIAMEGLGSRAKIIGCVAKGAPALGNSIRSGHATATKKVSTFADGIAVKVAKESMRALLAPRLDRVLYGDDEAMAGAVLTLMEKAKVIAEGAAALPLAVLDQMKERIRKKRVVLVISGGNIDVNVISRIIDRGLIKAGRRLRVNVLISDRPGSLNHLTEIIAENGANIIQAIHDRNEPGTMIDQTDVQLTLETKGPQHSDQVIRALQKFVVKLDVAH